MAVVAALAAAPLLAPTFASAAPHAAPDVNTVQKQLGELALKNTQLVEKFDQAQVQVAAKEKEAAAARQAADVAEVAFDQARAAMSATIAAQYEGGTFSATGALLSSQNGENYLDQLNTLGIISAHTTHVVTELGAANDAATAAEKQASTLLKTATTKRDQLQKKRVELQAQIDKYTALLSTLTYAQRTAFQNTLAPAVNASTLSSLPTATSAAAERAVKFALAQVGKPYEFGAAGPDAYDCSGLTMAAWAQGGVSLPHSAADQYNYGHHVSISSLIPGDLVFFYQPIGHVTIYIGDGLMVSAPQTGQNVSVVPLNSFDGSITGATRLTA
jgi:peptidoglycan DL-endopeptidase CwlO